GGERAPFRPHDLDEIAIPRMIPLDPLRFAAAGRDDAQIDLRVRLARARVLERDRRALRMPRVGDVDRLHRARIGALEADLLAVRRPPESAPAAQLLLRDELGYAVLEAFGMPGQPAGRAVGDQPEIALADESDRPAVGRQMWIVDGPLGIDGPSRAAGAV